MGIIVSKFGGTSMADADMFKRVKEIISRKSVPHYIVLSAPGKRFPGDAKITDLLYHANRLYASGEDGSEPLTEVRKRYSDIIHRLDMNIDPETFLSTLERDVRRSPDLAASRGEYLCARLFALYADIPFVDAASLIHFDEYGIPSRESIRLSVQNMAKRLPCAVIPGFYGKLPNGEIKTFSRGGSDITGALIAAALKADIYENWTDVDGLMSIDPAVCPRAIHHPAVSYRQMRRLANAGAKILHPYCLEPVCEAGIPTELRNTFAPERPGTYISDQATSDAPCICALDDLRALPLDSLNDETNCVLSGISLECYQSKDGGKLLALNACPLGQPACLITAFGIPPILHASALNGIQYMGRSIGRDKLSILVDPIQKKDTMCKLHEFLLAREDQI